MANHGGPFEADRPTPSQRALKWFDFAHLPPGPGRSASMEFRPLAHKLERILPDGPEKTMALRKLLETKDCAVRAAVEPTLPKPGLLRPIEVGDMYRLIEGAPGAVVQVVSMTGGAIEVIDQACGSRYSTVSSNLAPLGAEA